MSVARPGRLAPDDLRLEVGEGQERAGAGAREPGRDEWAETGLGHEPPPAGHQDVARGHLAMDHARLVQGVHPERGVGDGLEPGVLGMGVAPIEPALGVEALRGEELTVVQAQLDRARRRRAPGRRATSASSSATRWNSSSADRSVEHLQDAGLPPARAGPAPRRGRPCPAVPRPSRAMIR